MRFETVLFDLDGTVVDSGAIILASMRHATREVLGRDYSDEELLQTVGGPGLEAQMRALAPEHVERLVDVYRAHNEPLHDDLEACAGMEDVLVRLHEEAPRYRRARIRQRPARPPVRDDRRRGRDRATQARPGAAPARRRAARSGPSRERLRRRLSVRRPR